MVKSWRPENRAKFQTQQRKSEADKLYLNSIHFLEIGKAELPRFRALAGIT